MNYIISASTDIGNVKDTNQDGYGAKVFSTKFGKIVFAVLCDGMGGLEDGEVAAATVVKAFEKWSVERLPYIYKADMDDSIIIDDWTGLINNYNKKIRQYGVAKGINLGTTVTAILITNERYYIVNVGDSRTYEIADTVKVLTKDQTVVAREVEQGILSEEAAENDSRRSVLLQCVGASDIVYPDFFFGNTQKDAVYMLCSDGFRHLISLNEIHQYLQPNVMLDSDGMEKNMNTLILMNKQRQERDNITVLTIRTF